jgi:tetratricopeptide (TPR) repeat protein
LDGRTDLYALGGVLYEMLAGRTPYQAENMEGWMYQHLQGVPQPLERFRPELAWEHSGLEAIVMRLMAREREQRFPSATAALEALSAEPPAPVAKTAAEAPAVRVPKPKPTSQRSGGSVWAIAAILIAIGLGVWAGLRYLPPMLVTALPVLTPSGGTYAEAQPVVLSDATPFATIHYTVDGSPPTKTSPVYTQPITGLASGSTIRAVASTLWSKSSLEARGAYTWTGTMLLAAKPQEPSAYELGKAAFDKKDYALARTLFTQACEGDNMNACAYLGVLYGQGLGGPPAEQKARELYQKACDQGYLSSCTNLGIMDQDSGKISEARKYYQKACDGKVAEACELLSGIQ